MCNVNSRNTELEQQILATGLNIISKAIEANLSVNQSYSATDVLTTATNAYKEGKITKAQYFAVINALDENPEAPYMAYTQMVNIVPVNSPNRDYLDAHSELNKYRR